MAPVAKLQMVDGYRLTPMLQQYLAAKKAHPDAVLLFRMGDFFELFFDDAKLAARELDITLTSRDKGERPIPMAGVPHHAIEGYIAKLVARGYTVALCDQVEDAKLAQGLVRREITRVITPGTVSDLEALEPSRATYLAAVAQVPGNDALWAVAFLDLLAGELLCTVGCCASVIDELQRLSAREVLVEAPLLERLQRALRPQGVAVRAWGPDQIAGADGINNTVVEDAPQGAPGQALSASVREVWRYASATQKRSLTHVRAARFYDLQDSLIMDEATRQSLELTAANGPGAQDSRGAGSLFAHLNRARTSMGARLLRRDLLAPLTCLIRIARRADVVGAWHQNRAGRSQLQTALTPIRDLERLAGRVALGRATPRDVFALGQSLMAMPHVRTAIVDAHQTDSALGVLAGQWQTADLLQALTQKLAAAVVDEPPVSSQEGGIFRLGYDAALDALIGLATDSQAHISRFEAEQRQRTGISGLKVRYNRVFGYYIEISRNVTTAVPGDYIRRQTLANAERYVTSELKDFEQQVLEADGRRRLLEAELFGGLIEALQAALAPLRSLVRLVARTDALAALAEVADNHRYVRPLMIHEASCHMIAARHPVIEVMLPGGEPFVPNDVHLGGNAKTLMLVTGPNMAGKSTLMRQVALCAIMAQMGGFVPADSATLGICDRLYTRVGAQDNLSRGQSTFMVEMMETATILRHATPQSLVLLDEIGRGTSTFDGLSIAWAVAEHLHDVNRCRTLFATHYHELTELTRSRPRAVAMQVTAKEIDGEVVFLRQLQPGGADRSYGIEVARLAHMPEAVLVRAKEVLTELETGTDEPERQTPPGAEPSGLPRRRQLGLFAGISASPSAPAPPTSEAKSIPAHVSAIAAELSTLAVDHLTPMQALGLVHAWHQRLSGQVAVAQSRASSVARSRSRSSRPDA